LSEVNDWNSKVIDEFRANGGKVGGVFEGATILLLQSKGTKSHRERINPLACVREDGRFVVIASKGGAPTNPDWYHNIVANPELTVEVGTETFRVHATIVEEPERTRLYNKMVEAQPASVSKTFDEYRHKTTRKIPVILLTPMK